MYNGCKTLTLPKKRGVKLGKGEDNHIKRRTLRMFLLTLSLALCVFTAQADEFCGDTMNPAWQVIGSENVKVTHTNGMLGVVVPAEEEAYVLKEAKQGDWHIDTEYLSTSDQRNGFLHGLVVYGSEENQLVFGQSGDSVVAVLRTALGSTTLLECETDNYLRIEKITRGQEYTTYLLSTSVGGVGTGSWKYVGMFEDTEHLLDGARYGFYGTGSKRNSSVYGYFTETVLDYVYTSFTNEKSLSPAWRVKDGVTAELSSSMLNLTYATADMKPAIIRTTIDEDWRLMVRLAEDSISQGIMVYADEQNQMLFTDDAVHVMQNGTVETTSFGEEMVPWLRLTKQGNKYCLDLSADGSNWESAVTVTDADDTFAGAQYGIGAMSAEGCTGCVRTIMEMKAPNGLIWDVADHTYYGKIIGSAEDDAMTDTFSMAGLRSGDIGTLLDTGDQIYMMMGDSFSGINDGANWRSNVLMKVQTSEDMSKLLVTDIYKGADGGMRELITARHKDYDEMTCIPNSGVYVDGTLYYHYMSVYHWGIDAHWDVNFAGWAYSSDDGETWTKVENFFEPNSNFILTAMFKQDGYVYIYGIPAAKFGSVKLCRVPENAILDRSAYTFFSGVDEAGQPIWSDREEDAKVIVEDFVSELCVVYNAELERYLMAYMNEYTGNLIIRDAAELWGEWSNPIILSNVQVENFQYAPSTLPQYITENGRKLYYVTTIHPGYAISWHSVRLVTK